MNQTFEPRPVTAADSRVAARLTIGFVLDITDYGRQSAPLLDVLLLTAILAANLELVCRDPALQAAHARIDSPAPDTLRRPVSINALAESLRLPFETVRRHVRHLVAQGVCAVSPQGVYVPLEVIASEPFVAIQKARYVRVLRFYEDLLAAEAIEPLPVAPPPPEDPQAPVRAVGRLLSQYFFRMLDGLHDHVRDPLNGLILLQVLQLNIEHIAIPQLMAFVREGGVPDEARAAVRAAQVAKRLRIPYETARRHIGWLAEGGLLRRVDGGVRIDGAMLARPEMQALLDENLVNIRRMFRGVAQLTGGGERAHPAEP